MPDMLTSRVVSPPDVDRGLCDRLFELYDAAYAGGSRSEFDHDLAEKDALILLEGGDRVVGFSTQKVFDTVHEGRRLRILFSGDTIIDPKHWGSQELVRAWCRFAGTVKGDDPLTPLYWYLISKGHRTYLYLPLFFRSFYPSCDAATPPFEASLMRALGTSRYGDRFDPEAGLIDARSPHDRLREELDSAPQRTSNRHVAYFLDCNPRYAEGVELLCLAEITPENMRSFARRELERGMSVAFATHGSRRRSETRRETLAAATRRWIGSAAADAGRFARALENPTAVQEQILLKTVAANSASPYGRRHRFSSIATVADFQRLVPIVTWEDIAEDAAAGRLTSNPVLAYETTSGSSSPAKPIPYTSPLRQEFMAALSPWMHDLYASRPHLRGSAYWSVSPAVSSRAFADDRDYFTGSSREALEELLTLPPDVARITDLQASRYVTLRMLLADRHLSFISVWNPSFLTTLLRELDRWRGPIIDDIASGTVRPPAEISDAIRLALQRNLRPDPARAREIARARTPREIWPELAVISCWTDAAAALALPSLLAMFEGVEIQPKGLIATEGVVSIPYGREAGSVLAVRSHFLEFRDRLTGAIALAGELLDQREYDAILTTGGGLYRYALGDIVRVVGRTGGTPRIEFAGRTDDVADIAGEKLSEPFVRSALQSIGAQADFLVLAPEWRHGTPGYTLFIDAPFELDQLDHLAQRLDDALAANPHYSFCRAAGQLAAVRAVLLPPGAADTYLRIRGGNGSIGNVKPRALERELGWGDRLRAAEYVA